MRLGIPIGVASALGWFAFPLVPALLGSTYHRTLVQGFGPGDGPDPRQWGWLSWVVLTGPLLGYGFLAGATIDLADDPARRGVKGWASRRSIWVAAGPWVGFLAWGALFLAILLVGWAYPPARTWPGMSFLSGWAGWALIALALGSLAFGWLVVAGLALRRARRLGRARRALVRGLAVAVGFVGSLFGSFWAITEAWRGHFFDPRIMPALVAASSAALMLGCANTQTYGEVRRRELFQAMLMAWLIGLALLWRWWARSRPEPPGPS